MSFGHFLTQCFPRGFPLGFPICSVGGFTVKVVLSPNQTFGEQVEKQRESCERMN